MKKKKINYFIILLDGFLLRYVNILYILDMLYICRYKNCVANK